MLCAEALATNDELEIRSILGELRLVLHQRIEQLRSGLRVAYSKSIARPHSIEADWRSDIVQNNSAGNKPESQKTRPRTWRDVVHEIADEKDHGKALALSQELNRLLGSESHSSESTRSESAAHRHG